MAVEVFVEICRKDVYLPSYSRPGDAGMDICAADEILVKPGQTVVVPTGIKLALPVEYEVQIRPRSGISLRTPLRISNSPGTIDSGYRDEVCILVTNTSAICTEGENIYTLDDHGNKMGLYLIRKNDRIAQMVLCHVPEMYFTLVESIWSIGENRGGGFGSTGVRPPSSIKTRNIGSIRISELKASDVE